MYEPLFLFDFFSTLRIVHVWRVGKYDGSLYAPWTELHHVRSGWSLFVQKEIFLLAVQFGGARLRMEENLVLLRKQKDIGRYIWSSRHDLCRYWDEKESTFLSLYADPTQVHTVLSYSC